ncbi:MAG TPA: TonB-dependent receptor [Anaeromyxobacter sp.]
MPEEPVEEISVFAPARLPRRWRRGGLYVKSVDLDELQASGARTVQEALQSFPGIHLSDEQGNPLQQDLSMRGLSASPVTGLSQGVSVFVDGVRVNEPAVEEVNFDLLPLADVERVEIIRGPHAIFGRNALGGAIHLFTRRGSSTPTAEVQLEGASWLHQEVQARAAGPLGPLDAHLSFTESSERGWRDDETSRGLRAFGKVGLLRGDTDLALSYQYQVDRLEQPGSLPLSMLREDRSQNYTAGDFFRPILHLVTLNARQELGAGLSLAANAHLRSLDAEQFNASWSAANTRMLNRSRTVGGAVQLEHQARLGAVRSQAITGIEGTRSSVGIRVHEEANERFAASDPALIGDLADTQLGFGAFAQEQVQVAHGPLSGLRAIAALRFDWISHDITDASPPSSSGNATGAAAYARWVPALEARWTSAQRWSASASWSEGFRAPAFLELTCANPLAPCVGLQAGVAPDATLTRLRPVRSRSFEVGVTAFPLDGFTAALTAFRIDLHDDIYSVTAADTTRIYFQNVGDTRRQGLELAARVERGPVRVDLGYAWIRATFESDLGLATPRLQGGSEQVRPGDRLPQIPEHKLDLEARVRALAWLGVSAGFQLVGAQFLRGDEANVAPRLAAYRTLRAGVEARWGRWTAALRAANILSARYETFGTFATNGRNPAGGIEPFLTPGQPMRVVLSVRWELD